MKMGVKIDNNSFALITTANLQKVFILMLLVFDLSLENSDSNVWNNLSIARVFYGIDNKYFCFSPSRS